jgi:hypothetical protein
MEVYLPGGREWISYVQAAVALGQRFAEARGLLYSAKNPLDLQPGDLAAFAADILTASHERATLVLVDADNWRQGPSGKRSRWIWPQLKNENLAPQQNVLDLAHVSGHSCVYHRNDPSLHNLVAVIRLRHDDETPHYVPNRATWTDPTPTRDFAQSSGFCDTTAPDLLHYFSAGRLPDTQRNQNNARAYEINKREKEQADDPRNDKYGANIAFKHPQLVELVPFFVRPDLAQDDVLRALCRVAHYLRLSPAWTMGNTVLPYPMHLGQQLIADQLPILGLTE